MNRRVPILVAIAAIAFTGFVGSSVRGDAATAPSSPWAQTNADAAGSRDNRTESTLSTSNAAQIVYRRSVVAPPSGRGECFQAITAPVLVNGYVYTVTGDYLIKVNAATGATAWSLHFTTSSTPSSGIQWDSLSVASGLVVIHGEGCESQSDPGDRTVAFNATTGAEVWSANVNADAGLSMVVSNGFVVTGAGPDESGYGGGVVVRKIATGAVAWSTSVQTTTLCAGKVLVVDARVIFSACDPATGGQDIEARALATGALAWSHAGTWRALMGDTDTTASLHLFASGPDGVHDINPSTGVLGPVLPSNTNMLAVGPQRYFTNCGSGSSVCSYSLSTHALQWQRSIDTDSINIAAVAHGVLVLSDGQILNANTGAIITDLWNTDFFLAASTLAIGDGRVAVATDERVLDLYGLPGS